jgi:hypothetical protein
MVSQVAAYKVETASGTQIVLPIGSGAGAAVQPGHLLLLSIQWANNGSSAPSITWGGTTPTTGLTNRVAWSSPSAGSVSSGVYSWVVESGVTSITFTLAPADDGNVEAWAIEDWDDIIVATQAWSTSSETGAPPSRTSPNLANVPAGSLIYAGIDFASGSEVVTAVGGTIILQGDERRGVVASYASPVSDGTVTGKTFTWPTSGAYRVRTWTLAVTPAAVPTVQYANVGAVTDEGFSVAVKALNADEVQIRVGSTTSSAASFDSDGWATATISGLDPDTEYDYDIILDGTEEFNDYGTITTFPVPGTPTSGSFAFGSCFNPTTISGTSTGPFANILARGPRFWIHGGDYHYEDNSSTSTSSHVADMEKSLAYSSGLRNLHANAGCLYSPGDHDNGGNNAFAGPYTPATVAAKLKTIPFYDRPDSSALYHSAVFGRIRLIILDTRSKSIEEMTRLGSTQLAWLEEQLQEPEPVKFVWTDSAWMDTRPASSGSDTWERFDDERAEIVGYIDNAVGQVIIIHGDQHSLGADDGSNNPFGGVPVLSGAPYKQTTSFKTANPSTDWSNGRWPTTSDVGAEQYMYCSFTDDGEEIVLNFTGYDTSNTSRVTMTVNVEAPIVTGPTLKGRIGGSTVTFTGVAVRIGGATVPVTGMAIRQGGVTVPLV